MIVNFNECTDNASSVILVLDPLCKFSALDDYFLELLQLDRPKSFLVAH